MKAKKPRYSMVIEWSDLDNAYVVSFPEWDATRYIAHTHGKSYKQAARRGEETLRFLIESTPEAERPKPTTFDAHAYALGETAESIAAETKRLVREIEQHMKERERKE